MRPLAGGRHRLLHRLQDTATKGATDKTDRLDNAAREYKAQLERVGASRAVSVHLLREETKVAEDLLHDMLRVTMTGYVLAGAPQDVELHCDTPRGWWGHTWRVASAHPYTRWGKYLHAWANRRWPDHVERMTVNRKVCPHGHTAVAGQHLIWLADPRDVQAFRWPADQLTEQLRAGLAGMLLVEGVGYLGDDKLWDDLETYAGQLVADLHKIVVAA